MSPLSNERDIRDGSDIISTSKLFVWNPHFLEGKMVFFMRFKLENFPKIRGQSVKLRRIKMQKKYDQWGNFWNSQNWGAILQIRKLFEVNHSLIATSAPPSPSLTISFLYPWNPTFLLFSSDEAPPSAFSRSCRLSPSPSFCLSP